MDAKNEGVYFYLRMGREHGDALQLRFAHVNLYLFLHPDHNREILVDKADQFIKGKQYDSLRMLLGNGLLTSTGKDWAMQRKLMNPLFGKDGMDVLLTHINRITKKYADHVTLNHEFDWTKYMFDLTLEVAFASFFGKSFADKDLDKLVQASFTCIRFVSRRMSNLINPPVFLPLRDNQDFKQSYQYLKSTVGSIYNARLLAEEAPPRDLLDLLMKAEDNGIKLSQSQVWDQILSFMMAGHETTALTMSWLFYYLAQHPEAQEKIAEECKKNEYKFENSLAINQYPYLNAVLNETMRLNPAGWIISREAAEDSTIGDYKIKKGQVMAVSPLVTHRDPRWWTDPDTFIPERFLEGHELYNKAPKSAFLPFSLGKRNCIGARFAVLEMALLCIHFFKDHRVETTQKNVRMKGYVTLKPDKNIRVTVRKI